MRKLIALLMALMMIFSMCACGLEEGGEGSGSSTVIGDSNNDGQIRKSLTVHQKVLLLL